MGEFDRELDDFRQQKAQAIKRLEAIQITPGASAEAQRKSLNHLINALEVTIEAYEDVNAPWS